MWRDERVIAIPVNIRYGYRRIVPPMVHLSPVDRDVPAGLGYELLADIRAAEPLGTLHSVVFGSQEAQS